MNRFITFLLLIVFASSSDAQALKDQYIISLKKGQVDRFLKEVTQDQSRSLRKNRILSKDQSIVELVTESLADAKFEKALDDNPLVKSWAYNYKTHKRAMPDDEYFEMQWGLELIDAPSAWDVTTGGTDINNNEIVIAVLDDSYDLTHAELEGRILFNTAEIEDDGIDNDNNGYVDDYAGWNTSNENDNHPIIDNHGIAVSGIIGAKSDNQLGMTGINWNVKLLLISGISTQSEVIAGYQYVIDMRKKYNETNGQEGAFIVATNYSAGIDKAFGTSPQFKTWCDMYDAMGEVGILSAGATTNANVDVDLEGDMPTTCPSPFLIAVTNVNKDDTKVPNAGYGAENIDLGAPGRGTLTLNLEDGFDQSFGGTSAATPHVAGAIGLLYSAPCKSIADMSIDDPEQSAVEIREALFSGVDINTTLEGITNTNGRLNIYNSIEKLQAVCDELQLPSTKGPIEISKIKTSNPDRLEINYITPDETPYHYLITDRSGKTIRHMEFTPPSFGRKTLDIDIPTLASGIYFISIYNDNVISTQKLFINN